MSVYIDAVNEGPRGTSSSPNHWTTNKVNDGYNGNDLSLPLTDADLGIELRALELLGYLIQLEGRGEFFY